ncbi:MAG: hypothetical protein AAFX03_09305 [Pseudomonadota bacterium]
MIRTIIVSALVILLVALIGFVIATQRATSLDGSPDDRLLATMQYVALDAQTVLDETGDLPNSLSDLMAAVNRPSLNGADIGVSYSRLGPHSVQLCGDFEKRSSGQAIAQPFSDVAIELAPDLVTPRPERGHHCYDVRLESTAMEIRNDALLYRELNAAATAIECSFWAIGDLPTDIAEAKTLAVQERDDPACRALSFKVLSNEAIRYSVVEEATIRLCAEFRRSFHRSDASIRLFDPRTDSRFFELAQERPEAGAHCYEIRLLLPDPPQPSPAIVWDEPLDVESLPSSQRDAANRDGRAIGEVVNVLRLMRCAFTIGSATPVTIQDAIQTIPLDSPVAKRYNCGWVPSYFSNLRNPYTATYEPLDDGEVRVCAQFELAWKHPLALHYYGRALEKWPSSLPELQRSLGEPGLHCFTVQLTKIGSGAA